jgi:aldose 1-epimerase
VNKAAFGTTPEGEAVDVYTMTNAQGMEVRAITFGGIITSIRVPDKAGKFDDVVLGFDTLDGYLKNPPFLGAIIGRYANRIGKGRFTLDGKTYTLAINNAPNHLHGGSKGSIRSCGRQNPSRERKQSASCSRTRAPTPTRIPRGTVAASHLHAHSTQRD